MNYFTFFRHSLSPNILQVSSYNPNLFSFLMVLPFLCVSFPFGDLWTNKAHFDKIWYENHATGNYGILSYTQFSDVSNINMVAVRMSTVETIMMQFNETS
jgi:hypothetical protein